MIYLSKNIVKTLIITFLGFVFSTNSSFAFNEPSATATPVVASIVNDRVIIQNCNTLNLYNDSNIEVLNGDTQGGTSANTFCSDNEVGGIAVWDFWPITKYGGAYNNSTFSPLYYRFTASTTEYYIRFDFTGSGWSSINSTSSQIISFDPAFGSTTASTTVYMSVSGYNAGEYDYVTIQSIGDSVGADSHMISWAIEPGFFTATTTSERPAGQYWGWVKMYNSQTGSYIQEDLKYRVATSSPEVLLGLGLQAFGNVYYATSSGLLMPDCSLSDFHLGKCLYSLVVPPKSELISLLNEATSTLLARAPFGYATRIFSILLSPVATGTLPTIALTIPANLPGGGKSVDLSPWQYMSGVKSWLSTTTPSHGTTTIWSNITPGFNMFWTFLLAIYLFFRIRGLLAHEAVTP